LAGEHLRLAVQWQVPGELRHRDVRQQRGRRQAAVDRARRRLHHRTLAGATAISRPPDALDPDDRGHDVEHLADVFPDAMQCALAAGAGIGLGLDDDVLARQMFGQTTDIACRLRACRPILPSWPGSGLSLRFDRRRREILELEEQLPGVGIEPLRPRAKQGPFQRLQHRPKLVVFLAQLGDHSDQDVGIARQRSNVRCQMGILLKCSSVSLESRSRSGELFRRHRGRAHTDLPPVHAREQKPQLCGIQRHRAVTHLRPGEGVTFQSLGDET